MLGSPLQNQVRDIDAGGTDLAARLTIQTGLHHPLGIQVAIVLGRDDFEPSARTHVLGLKDVVDGADRIALGTGGAGFRQPRVVDMFGERGLADFDAGIQHTGRIEHLFDLDEQT